MLIPRSLIRRPGFAVTVIATLAVATSTVTVMATIADKVLIDAPPFGHPDQLMLITHRYARLSASRARVPGPDVGEIAGASRTLEDVAFVNGVIDANLVDGETANHTRIAVATPNLFHVLQASVDLGRSFRRGEGVLPSGVDFDSVAAQTSAPIVLGHQLWLRRFGGDSAVIGRRVSIDGRRAEVIGVLPAAFVLRLPSELGVEGAQVDAWVPLAVPLSAFRRPARFQDQDSDNTGIVIGRLRGGATLAQTRTDLERVAGFERAQHVPYRDADMHIVVEPLHEAAVAAARPLLTTLVVAAVLVLLVASLNVAGLSLARAEERRTEMAVRGAIGAPDHQLFLVGWSETALLVMSGGCVGLVGAAWLAPGLQALAPTVLASRDLEMSAVTVAGVVGLVALGAILAGIPPGVSALRSAGAGALGRRGAFAPRRRVRDILVTGQFAVAFTLMLFVGLLAHSVVELRSAPVGFRADRAAVFGLSLRAGDQFRGPAGRAEYLHRLMRQLEEHPAVEAAGVTAGLPLSGTRWTQPWSLTVDELPQSGREAVFRPVTSGYFRAMGTRLLAGRTFSPDEDLNERRRVAIVDDSLAHQLDPHGSVLGRTIAFPLDGEAVRAEIVGVVATVRYESLRDPGRPTIYVPYRQEASRDVSVVLRTTGDPRQLAQVSNTIVGGVDPVTPVYDYQPLAAYVSRAMGRERIALLVVGGFAGLAGLMSVLGLYATVAYLVRRRVREFGVRVALGATGRRIVRGVVAEAMTQVGIGLLLGTAVAILASGPVRPLLYEVTLLDPSAWLLAAVVLSFASIAACYVPARIAAGTEPLEALRNE